MRAKVLGGVNLAWASVRQGHGIGSYRRQGHDRFTPGVTQRARGFLRQAFKRLGLGGTIALGFDGLPLCWPLSGRGNWACFGQMKTIEFIPIKPWAATGSGGLLSDDNRETA